MSVKTWGKTETGNIFHSFNADGVAICRSNLKAGYMFTKFGGMYEFDARQAGKLCGSCAKREAAFRERAEASMQPVGEYDQVCESITGHGDAVPAKTPAKTPAVAVARVLRGLGLAQGVDFKIKPVMNDGFRIGTRVAVYGTKANEVIANHANEIEEAVKADGGWSMQVSIFFAPGGTMWVSINNVDKRVRQTHFTSELGRTRQTDPDAGIVTVAPDESAPVVAASSRVAEDVSGCVDGQGEFYPEHDEDEWGGECARCGAEMVDVTEDEAGSGTTYAGQTPEEQRAAIVRRFPRGTAVMWTDGSGLVRHGVVNGLDVGTVTEPGHVNEGRVYVGVDAEPLRAGEGRAVRTRLFADMLTGPDEAAVREALGL